MREDFIYHLSRRFRAFFVVPLSPFLDFEVPFIKRKKSKPRLEDFNRAHPTEDPKHIERHDDVGDDGSCNSRHHHRGEMPSDKPPRRSRFKSGESCGARHDDEDDINNSVSKQKKGDV